MTDCTSIREWILEVDPEELEEAATGEHAEHLAECPECRTLAVEILGAEAALRDTLDSVEPALDVEAALVRAREAHESRPRYRHWRVALPLAAAALGGLLLLDRPPTGPSPGSTRRPWGLQELSAWQGRGRWCAQRVTRGWRCCPLKIRTSQSFVSWNEKRSDEDEDRGTDCSIPGRTVHGI